MGTNYYLHEKQPCPCCGRGYEPLHIGKSSHGWAFALHVIPDEGLNSLDDWKARWIGFQSWIEDEYGRPVTPSEMLDVITNRKFLMRADDARVVGHGDSWDLVTGDFS